MNRAIVTTMIDNEGEILGSFSLPRMEDYAKKVNARLIVIKQRFPPFSFIAMSKFFIERHLPSYSEGMFYIDIDALISRDAPNVFELCPTKGISGVWDSTSEHPDSKWNKYIKASAALAEIEPWEGYFNAGVVMIRPDATKLFANPDYFQIMPWFPDQTIMNLNRTRFNIPYYNLGSQWNLMNQNGGNESTWPKAHIAHFAGIDMQTRIQLMHYVDQKMP